MATTQVKTDLIEDGAVTSAKLDTNIAIDGNLTVDTNTLYVDSANNRVGIGTTSPQEHLHIKDSTAGDSTTIRIEGFTASANDPIGTLEFYNTTDAPSAEVAGFIKMQAASGGRRAYEMLFGTGNVAAADTKMIIDKNGNVGIGTTSPRGTLDIDGARGAYFTTFGSGSYQLIGGNTGSSTAAFRIDAVSTGTGAQLQFATDGTERLRIDSNGNVGIGGVPSVPLNIQASNAAMASNGIMLIQANSAVTNNGGQITLGTTSSRHAAVAGRQEGASGTAGYLQFGTRASSGDITERMRIDSSGNVGIGTTAPEAKLHIIKTNQNAYVDAFSTAVIEDAEARLQLCASNGGSNAGAITISNGSSHWSMHHRGPSVGNYLAFGYASTTSTTDIVAATNDGIAMALTTGGNVGIGTTSPEAKLHLNGGSLRIDNSVGLTANIILTEGSGDEDILLEYDGTGFGSGNYFSIHSNVSSWVGKGLGFNYIPSNGRVGIGTTSPDTKLEVIGDIALGGTSTGPLLKAIKNGGTTYDNIIYYNNQVANNDLYLGRDSSNIILRTNNSERMRITSGGNVGIGTTSPAEKLHVVGNIKATGDVVADCSSDERLKDNINVINNPIDKIKKIKGVEFDWNDKQSTYEGHDIGVIAQDIEKVLPELVSTRDNGYKAVKYDKLTALLIEAVKQQQEQIEKLEKLILKQ